MLDKIAQPQKKKRMEMATYVSSRRISAITLMTILALTGVARPILAADHDAADLVPGEPRVLGVLSRGVAPAPTGSILDSAHRQLSRQIASRAEQAPGTTAKRDSLWNGTIIGAVGGFAAMGVGLGSIYANNEGGGVCLPCIGYFGAIGAGIGAGIGALVDLVK
jgi:hypothetical protein